MFGLRDNIWWVIVVSSFYAPCALSRLTPFPNETLPGAQLKTSASFTLQIWLGLLLSIRLKVIHDENAAYGIVWGGWRKGYYHVEAENMTTPPPPNYYKMINVKPGAPMQYVQRRCDERIATMAAKKKLTEEENARLRDITDGCRILTVDYERCYYDARKQLRDGLWEGYVEEVCET